MDSMSTLEPLSGADVNHEGNSKHEAHEEAPDAQFRMRRRSPLSPDADRMMTHTISAAIAVHRALGPGFLESIYRKAMCVELEARDISFEVERAIRVAYRGIQIPG